MGHTHSVQDTNAHFTIDQYTRVIKNDSGQKTTIVQYDHNSEVLTFELPRYIDKHDMTLCDLITIHFINVATDGKSQNNGSYEVGDIHADGDNAVFTWKISDNATQLVGSLNFLITFECTESGSVVYRWSTELNKTLAISAGLDNGEAVIMEYPDILAQWKAQLFEASETAVLNVTTAEANALAAIESAGEAKKQAVLESIPDEYETLSANVDTNAAKIKLLANAITGSMSGAVVRADDVSPAEHGIAAMVRGKNLYHSYTTREVTTCGITANMDSSASELTLNGTATQGCSFTCGADLVLPANTYTASVTGLNINGTDRVYITETDEANVIINSIAPDTPQKFTLEKETAVRVKMVVGENSAYSNTSVSIQIEKGDTATDYEEWIDPATVTVTRYGKNLARGGTSQAYTQSGITLTRAEDSSRFTVDGTAEVSLSFAATKSVPLTPGTYTVSVQGLNTVSAHLDRCFVYDTLNAKVLVNDVMVDSPKSFTLTELAQARIELVFAQGSAYSNRTVLLQMECGDIATEYEDTREATAHTPNAGGTVDEVTSLSPTMTLLTDTEGVTIECEYNRDTNKVIAEIFEKIEALS